MRRSVARHNNNTADFNKRRENYDNQKNFETMSRCKRNDFLNKTMSSAQTSYMQKVDDIASQNDRTIEYTRKLE